MYRPSSRRSPAVLTLALVLTASSCAPAATQLIVTVDTDLLIPGELDHIRVEVAGPSGSMATEEQAISSASSLPLTLAVIPSGDVLGPIEVIAIGLHGTTEVIRRDAEVTLVRGETRVLPLFLLASCRGVTCLASQTCGEAGCASRVVTMLPPWTGQPPRIPRDAGPMDAPSVDAPGADAPGVDAPGVDAPGRDAFELDTGPSDAGPPCTSAAECDDGVACTSDTCNGASGCVHGPNDTTCDDGQICTTDICRPTGCVHPPNDGVSCGMATCGAYGACGDFPSLCAESGGSETRTCMDATCSGGACGSVPRIESRSCTRSTTGAACGGPSCGAWGPCLNINQCATTGTETRSCTATACSGGTCAASGAAYNETQACTRSTEGNACDVDRCSSGSSGTCVSGYCDGISECPEPCICGPGGGCRQGGSFCPIS